MKAIAIIGGASLLAMASGAGAQTSDTAAQAESAGGLGEIVVTAQRREERLQDVPLTITALSGASLEKAGVTSVFELQNSVSGLNFGGVGNSALPAIRSVSTGVTTNSSENPNAFYVDGIYMSQQHLLGASLPDVARIEVLKGPQGTLFGRNSLGGAIRLFTKDPTFETTGDFTLEAGMHTGGNGSRSSPRINARGFVSLPLVDEIAALSLSGGYDWTEGFLTNDATGARFGLIRRENARAKLLIKPADSAKIVLSAFYLKHRDDGLLAGTPIDRLSASTAYPGTIVPTQPWHTVYDTGGGLIFAESPVRSYGFSGNIELNLDGLGTLTSTTGYVNNKIRSLTTISWSSSTPACLAAFACLDYDYHAFSRSFQQELNFASEKFGIFSMTGGLFYFDLEAGSEANVQKSIIAGGVTTQLVRFKTKSYAAYGELQIEPTDRLTLILGGRYTHEPHRDAILKPVVVNRDETFNSFVPRLSVKYALAPELNVYANLSRGEKSGLTGVANTQSTPPFAPVDPEEITAYEVGVKFAARTVSFNLSGFYYDYKNKQEQVFTGTSGFVQNTGPVRIYGFDADATVRLSPDFSLRANATWVPEAEYRDFRNAASFDLSRRTPVGTFPSITIDVTGQRLLRSPEFTGNVTLDYSHETERGTIDASANLAYSSSVFHDYLIRQKAYATLGGRAGYTFGDSGMRIGVYGRNLTNKAYIGSTLLSGLGITASYARPREVGISLSFAQ